MTKARKDLIKWKGLRSQHLGWVFYFFHTAELVNLKVPLWSYNQTKVLLANRPHFSFKSLASLKTNRCKVFWRWHRTKTIRGLCMCFRWSIYGPLSGGFFSPVVSRHWPKAMSLSERHAGVHRCLFPAVLMMSSSGSEGGAKSLFHPLLHGWVGVCTYHRVLVECRDSSVSFMCD